MNFLPLGLKFRTIQRVRNRVYKILFRKVINSFMRFNCAVLLAFNEILFINVKSFFAVFPLTNFSTKAFSQALKLC